MNSDSSRELAELLGVASLGPRERVALARGEKLRECNPGVAFAAILLGAINFPCSEADYEGGCCDESEDCEHEADHGVVAAPVQDEAVADDDEHDNGDLDEGADPAEL